MNERERRLSIAHALLCTPGKEASEAGGGS